MSAAAARTLGLGFLAGFVATLVVHQGVWALLYGASLLPSSMPPWPLDLVPPFGVPAVVSKAFWGGLWGAALGVLLHRREGAAYWLSWLSLGALAPTLAGVFVVPVLKGLGAQAFDANRFAIGCVVNGAWGLGTGALLRLTAARRAPAIAD